MPRSSNIGIDEGKGASPSPFLALIPGLRDIASGRRKLGTYLLFILAFLLIVLVTSFDKLAAGLRAGKFEMWLAAAVLFASLAGLWAREIRAVLKPPPPAVRRREMSPWSITVQQFKKNRMATFGLCCMIFLYLVALLAPLIAPYDPNAQENIAQTQSLAPSPDHPMGTDKLGRDVFSRVIYGSRISLSIGFIAVGISITVGSLLGAVAGYLGGATDNILMRFVDMLLSFPRLVLVITVVALFSPSIFLLIAVLGATGWMGTSRIVRGQVLALREQEFVHAVKALGLKDWRILLRHVLPNTMAPIIVSATLGIGNTILLEAGLSFLGLGVQPPTPSWGSIINDGRGILLLDAWWIATFPGLAIVLTVICFNLLGDGLRDALDPRLRA